MAQSDGQPKTDESSIVSEFFEVWLDEDTPPAADPGRSSSPTDLDDPNELAELIARTSECARMISQHWPASPAASPMEPDPGDTGSFIPAVTSASLPSVAEWLVGPVPLGRFVLQAEIGRGRFGIVYRASDPQLNRDVAIKVAREEVVRSPELAERFLREAIAAGGLDHPGIVPVYESGEADGAMYYVMPYVEGEDLAHWLERQQEPVDQRLAAELIRQAAIATAYGHGQGILHRDLKPANIILKTTSEAADPTHQARILDFGLSRSLDWDLSDTRSSVILGTPLYMSPEQAQVSASQVGPTTDVFALGCILYELLTGAPPFAAASFPQIIEQLRGCEPVSPRERRPEIDSQLEQICLKCLRLYPEDRYSSAQKLADDLQRYLNGDPILATHATTLDRVRWWAKRPQRIRDAGITTIVVNVSLVASMAVTASAPLVNPGLAPGVNVAEHWVSQLPPMLLNSIAMWVGVKIIQGADWALWLGTAGSIARCCFCIFILLGVTPAQTIYDGNPLASWIVHQFLLLLFAVEVAAFGIAIHARVQGRASAPSK